MKMLTIMSKCWGVAEEGREGGRIGYLIFKVALCYSHKHHAHMHVDIRAHTHRRPDGEVIYDTPEGSDDGESSYTRIEDNFSPIHGMKFSSTL